MSTGRLYQPNLTCSFDVTFTDDNVLWNLVMKNHDDQGVQDVQFIEQIWQFTNVWTSNLIKHNLFKKQELEKPPHVDVIMTHDKKYRTFSVLFNVAEDQITPTRFAAYLGEFCKNMSKEYNIQLEGLNVGQGASSNGNGSSVPPNLHS